jgi:tetratricopeptide (TPR) repeat protein
VAEPRQLLEQLLRANELRRQKQYHAAITLYLQVIERFGAHAYVLATIAHCYTSLAYANAHESDHYHQEAVVWMEKAVTLAPNDARLHAILAQYYDLGILDYEQAAREYRKAIDLNPNDVWALTSAASLYKVPENVITHDEAIRWLERATQLEPGDPNYLARLGELYYDANRLQDAQRAWLSAVLCPRSLDAGYAEMIERILGVV